MKVYANRNIVIKVEVKNHKISAMEVLEKGDSDYVNLASEAITHRVLNDQENVVDVVSGATTSSKAMLKALENALSKNFQNR